MDDKIIPEVAERAEIDTVSRTTGTVRVETVVHVEPQPVEASLSTETIEVERVPVDRFVDGPVPDRTEGDTLIISVLAEVPVVEKRLKVVEEVHLRRVRSQRTVAETVPLRREEVRVERVPHLSS